MERSAHIHGHLGAGLALDDQGHIIRTDSRLARTVLRADSHGHSARRSKNWVPRLSQQALDAERVLYTARTFSYRFVYVCDTTNDRIQMFDFDGLCIDQWGSSGTDLGEFSVPYDIESDSQGNVYVVDSANNRIQKFDAFGEPIREWGSYGTALNEFDEPSGIAIDSEDNIYIVDTYNNRIQKFANDGTPIKEWGSFGTGSGEFDTPFKAEFDANDILYVADTANHRIQKFDTNGGFLGEWGAYGSGDQQLDSPTDVVISTTGFIFVTDNNNHRIQKFNASGTSVFRWGSLGTDPGEFTYPHGITRDHYNRLYVTDESNHRVQKFDVDGGFLIEWGETGTDGGEFQHPSGISVGKYTGAFPAGVKTCNQNTDGLVACYAFTGNANDGSGNGHHGTVYGAVPSYDRVMTPKHAYKFDGVDDYIEVPFPGYLANGTITCWVKLVETGGSPDVIQIEAASGGRVSLEAVIGSADFTFSIWDGGWKIAASGIQPSLCQWYYLAGSWGSGGLKIYVNSVLKDTFAYYLGIPADSVAMYIGAHPYYSRYIEGVIDAVRIFDRQLSLSEIEALEDF